MVLLAWVNNPIIFWAGLPWSSLIMEHRDVNWRWRSPVLHYPSLILFAIRGRRMTAKWNRVRSLKPVAELVVARWEAPEGMQVARGAQQLPDSVSSSFMLTCLFCKKGCWLILTLTRTSWAFCHKTLMSIDFDTGISEDTFNAALQSVGFCMDNTLVESWSNLAYSVCSILSEGPCICFHHDMFVKWKICHAKVCSEGL